MADAPAGIGPSGEEGLAGRHRRGRATRRAAGDGRLVPRVVDRAVGAVLVARAHRELVAVRLAEEDGARRAEALLGVAGVRRAVALQDPAAGGRGQATADRLAGIIERPRDEDVLQRVGDPEQRPLVAPRERLVGGIGRLERTLGRQRQERVQALAVPVDACQAGLDQVAAAHAPLPQQRADLVDRPIRQRQFRAHRPSSSTTGTRSIGPSRSGAFARAASRGIGWRTSSSRMTFSSAITWAVGPTWLVSTSASLAIVSRIDESWTCMRSISSSLRPRRARRATCSTSARLIMPAMVAACRYLAGWAA